MTPPWPRNAAWRRGLTDAAETVRRIGTERAGSGAGRSEVVRRQGPPLTSRMLPHMRWYRGPLRRCLVPAVLAAAACAGGSAPAPAAPPVPAARPKLVVLIAVDQLRGDYFPRWSSQLTGGLGRFWREGAFFAEGRQDHAVTETAPGHSTMLSGRVPAHTNIVTNEHGVLDLSSPLLELKDGGLGASPARFRGTTLFDWMRAAEPAARVLSVSRKDRGAILPVGRFKGDVFWYAGGIFTTSTWYRTADTLPGWVREWNASEPVRKVAGWTWRLALSDPAAYPEPDSLVVENGGRDVAFPHQLTPNIDAAAVVLPNYPIMDSLTLAFALRGVERLRLGQGEATDLLVVSLSSTDAVGHGYGPDSRELHDQVLQLDRWLGNFLDSLWRVVPRERMLLALTADHGIAAMPEYLSAVKGQAAGRIWFGNLATELNTRFGAVLAGREPFGFRDGILFGDVGALARAGMNVDSIARVVSARMSATTGVRRVFTPAMLTAAPAADPDARLCRRSLPKDFGWLTCGFVEPNYIWSPAISLAMHGSAQPDDQRVPVAFLGPAITASQYPDTVSVTDIAPTLAALLGVRPGERLDGRVLTSVVPQASGR
jgi:arylsulfatase A-like enzyme